VDRQTPGQLTPAEAKARLRAAAREVGLAPWMRRHPWAALGFGGVAGYLLGSLSPDQRREAGSLLLTLVARAGRSGRRGRRAP
jgi:hypothetical protein